LSSSSSSAEVSSSILISVLIAVHFAVGLVSGSRIRPSRISTISSAMHPSTRALSWKSAGTGGFDEFVGLKASFDVDRYRAKEAEPATKSSAPIRVATFDC
jgi:hypothetical protein